MFFLLSFAVLQCTTRYGWYVLALQGTGIGGTLVRSHVPCVVMLGIAWYSLLCTIPIASRYIGTD